MKALLLGLIVCAIITPFWVIAEPSGGTGGLGGMIPAQQPVPTPPIAPETQPQPSPQQNTPQANQPPISQSPYYQAVPAMRDQVNAAAAQMNAKPQDNQAQAVYQAAVNAAHANQMALMKDAASGKYNVQGLGDYLKANASGLTPAVTRAPSSFDTPTEDTGSDGTQLNAGSQGTDSHFSVASGDGSAGSTTSLPQIPDSGIDKKQIVDLQKEAGAVS